MLFSNVVIHPRAGCRSIGNKIAARAGPAKKEGDLWELMGAGRPPGDPVIDFLAQVMGESRVSGLKGGLVMTKSGS